MLCSFKVAIICSATKVNKLDIATSAELKEAVRRIHACKPTSAAREQAIREKTLGFSFMGYNILNDLALDSVLEPAEQFMSDWMHCLFVGGVWNICLQMVLRVLWQDGIRDAYSSLFAYVQRLRFRKDWACQSSTSSLWPTA